MKKAAFVAHLKTKGLWPAGAKLEKFVTPQPVAGTTMSYARAKFDAKAGLLEVTFTRIGIKKATGAWWYFRRLSRKITETEGVPLIATWPADRIWGLERTRAKHWWLCKRPRREIELAFEENLGPPDSGPRYRVELTYRWLPVPWRLSPKKERWAYDAVLHETVNIAPAELKRLLQAQQWKWTWCPIVLGPKGQLNIACRMEMINDVFHGKWRFVSGALYFELKHNTYDPPAQGCYKIMYSQPRHCTVGPEKNLLCLSRLDRCGWRASHPIWTKLPKNRLPSTPR
jgi:hypothetical protein